MPIYDLGTESCLVWRQRSGEPCPLPPPRALASPFGEFTRVHNAGAGYSLSSPDFLQRASQTGGSSIIPQRASALTGHAQWPGPAPVARGCLGRRVRVGGRLGSASPSVG